jgi:c-di-GMP-binding flagellar brake protein YcgR
MNAGTNSQKPERRRYPRFKAQLPVELRTGEDVAPVRTSTAEISVGGCYIESMFTLSTGLNVMLTLWVNEQTIRTNALVATRHQQVGNGFEFVNLSSEDRVKINDFIRTLLEAKESK